LIGRGSRTVLLIDSNLSTRRLLASALFDADYGVVEAAGGHEGMALARALQPDVVVLDLELPPFSGLEVMEWLRADEHTRHLPVVLTARVPSDPPGAASPADEPFVSAPDVEGLLAHLERVVPQGDR
jgi:CheY-like chemotaxis protein